MLLIISLLTKRLLIFVMSHKMIKNQRGAIGVLITLIIGFTLAVLSFQLALSDISSRNNVFTFNQSEEVFIPIEGCAEEALLRLSWDATYTGGNYTIGGVNCTVSVSGLANKDMVVTGELNNITRDLFIRAWPTPLVIMEWSD